LIKFNLKPPDDESGGFFDLQICLKKRAVEPGASAQLNWKGGSKKFDIT
jgi:hypothetical protein